MENKKVYDLEERTYLFALSCRKTIQKLPKTISNIEDNKQLVKSSGSIAANYIETNEKLGDKDFIFRLKIARKEDKESMLWLQLQKNMNPDFQIELQELLTEADELRKILSTIINKS
jgi:four helix bundle protein